MKAFSYACCEVIFVELDVWSLKFTVVPSIINVALALPCIVGLVTVPIFSTSLNVFVVTLFANVMVVLILSLSPKINVDPWTTTLLLAIFSVPVTLIVFLVSLLACQCGLP